MILFYDFEVTQYDWLVVIIDPINNKETVIVNDPMKMKRFYEAHKGDIWVGFNNRNYDQYILKAILCGFDPYEVSYWIVNKKRKGWEFSNVFHKIPLISFDVFTGYHGLKTLEAFMGMNIVETSVPFDIGRKLKPEEIEEMIYYCRHDVQNTIEVFLKTKNEFDAHMDLIKEFNLPLSYLGKTQAQLAAKILGAVPITLNDEFDLRLPHTLKLGKYQFVADWFMGLKESVEKELGPLNMGNYEDWSKMFYSKKLEVDVAGIPHIFGMGGIHGSQDNFIYICQDDEVLVMRDVESMYPTMMIQYNLLSRAVTNKNRFINVYNTNLRYKREKNKKRREPFKRICNIVYGATGDRFNPMYDPLHRNLVCVFGQLLLLDLVEKIEPYVEVKQDNTDGTFFLVKKNNLPIVNKIIAEWEERVLMKTSEDVYVKCFQSNVNNYIIQKEDGSYKSKGSYVKQQSDLDYDLPIINKAMTEYMVNGTPVEETINNCDELIEFQKVVKISGKYLRGWHNGEFLNDKTFRVFASKLDSDSLIGKQKAAGETIEKFANTPEHCFINNGDIRGKRIPRWLDKQWYIDETIKRLKGFGVIK